jgi:hypothetical protein
MAASAQDEDVSSWFHDHQDMNEGRGMSEQTTKRPVIEEIIARYKLFNMYRSPTSNQASAIYSRAEFELYSDIEVLLTERGQLVAIADAARALLGEMTPVNYDDYHQIYLCEYCRGAMRSSRETFTHDDECPYGALQAELAALDAGEG